MALARELIGRTQLDMERVAERAGFASTRQLRRAWRKFHATPPREARRRLTSDARPDTRRDGTVIVDRQ